MLHQFELDRIKDQRFYSDEHKCFVTIEGHIITIADRVIDIDKVTILDKDTQKIISNVLYETKTKCRLDKEVNYKGAVLLGVRENGIKEWLQPPKWDCEWYWGFGYIQTPHSHTHFSSFVGHQDNGVYIHNVYDSPRLVETTFTEREGWNLSELFKQFYLLREMAEYSHRSPAGCHLTTSPVTQDAEKMKEWHKYINEVMIPKVTDEIMRMLTPLTGGK